LGYLRQQREHEILAIASFRPAGFYPVKLIFVFDLRTERSVQRYFGFGSDGFTGMFPSAADTTIAASTYVGVWDTMIGAQVAKKWLGSCYPWLIY